MPYVASRRVIPVAAAFALTILGLLLFVHPAAAQGADPAAASAPAATETAPAPVNAPSAQGQDVGQLPPIVVVSPKQPPVAKKTKKSVAKSPAETINAPQVEAAFPPEQTGSGGAGDKSVGPVDATGIAMGYNIQNSGTATKTSTPLIETPATVNVVTQAELEDRAVVTPAEAFRYTPNILPANGGRSLFDQSFYIRGFKNTERGDIGATYYRDGLRLIGIPFPVASLDRIELLKGPASVLYGRAEPGGIVNAVTKRPLDVPYFEFEQQIGSYGLNRTALDAAGPVDAGKNLLFRIGLEYTDTDSFQDFISNNLFSVAPQWTLKLSDQTQANLQLEYTHEEGSPPSGIPAIGRRPANIPISRFIGDSFGSSPDNISDSAVAALEVVHRFDENWALRWNALYAWQHLVAKGVLTYGESDVVDEAAGQFCCGSTFIEPDDNQRTAFTSLNLSGKVDSLGVRHNLLFGYDYMNYQFEGPFQLPFLNVDFNIFDPAYGQISRPRYDPTNPNAFTAPFFVDSDKWHGLYVQDQIDVTKWLHLLAGVRYEHSKALFTTDPDESPTVNDVILPRYGIVVEPLPGLSTYYGYVESFGAPNGLPAPGLPAFEPETGRQHEVGVKMDFFGGRLSATVAAFDLVKQNILSDDPNNIGFSIATGEARSRGVEVEISGALTDRLDVTAYYAYLDTEITKDSGTDEFDNPTLGNLGNELPNAPHHSGGIYLAYDLTERLKVGGGVVAVGERQGDLANSYDIPGYARVDAMVAYTWPVSGLGWVDGTKATAQLNVNNLFDEVYFTHSNESRTNIYPGEPLTVMGTFRLQR